MDELMLKIDNVSKMYKLGEIGGTTLYHELQRLSAKMHGKEDPTKKIGAKDYNKGETFLALDGISFEVKKGERVGIIGHNGAGKSTLLKLISRVTAPTGGTIGLNGRVASMLEVGTGFHGELTGRENIYMNGAILGMTKKEIDAKMEDIIEFSECRQFIDTPVKRYSSGMYVKLAFSVAAHLDSEIMIMDEVLAVGDMAFQKKCLEKMSDVSKSEGRTILYVSHNMNTIRQLCDRVVVLDHGKVVFDGDVEEGIAIYSGVVQDQGLPVFYDLSSVERQYGFGEKLFITSFEFLDKTEACFQRKDKIEFRIAFDSTIEFKNAHVIVSIRNSQNSRSFYAMISEPFEVKIGTEQSVAFEFDAKYLTEDEYCLLFELIERDNVGNHLSYDNPDKMIAFKIINNDENGLVWHKRYWGNIRLPDMKRVL